MARSELTNIARSALLYFLEGYMDGCEDLPKSRWEQSVRDGIQRFNECTKSEISEEAAFDVYLIHAIRTGRAPHGV